MLVGGTSFAVLRRVLTGGVSWREQPELRAYLGIFVLATGAITIDLVGDMPDEFGDVGAALTHAAF